MGAHVVERAEGTDEAFLDRATELADEGRFDEALEILEQVTPARAERWLIACDAWTELGDLERASAALEEARRTLAPDDPDLIWHTGRLELLSWRFDAARDAFARLDREREGAPLLENLAILADVEGDAERAHALLVEAHRKSGGRRPAPLRMEPGEFEKVVAEAASQLPEESRDALQEVAVVIDPMPSAGLVDPAATGHPPDLLGLFVGIPFPERDSGHSGELPPTIFLFQRNLERACSDYDELRDEIATTLYHELGHALGFDEEGVEEMGLG